MRILVVCEGANEEAILNILLDSGLLCFSRDELIGRRVYHVRQLNHPFLITELNHNGDFVLVYRIGDKQNDELKIPKELKKYIIKKNIKKYCTKPELEMLLIFSEGLEKKYEKTKNCKSPKSFAKENIKINGKKYNQSTESLCQYFSGDNIDKLVDSIKKYKRNKKHKKDELYLADLLK